MDHVWHMCILTGIAVFYAKLYFLLRSGVLGGHVQECLRPIIIFKSQMIIDYMAQVWNKCIMNGVAMLHVQLQSLVKSYVVGWYRADVFENSSNSISQMIADIMAQV